MGLWPLAFSLELSEAVAAQDAAAAATSGVGPVRLGPGGGHGVPVGVGGEKTPATRGMSLECRPNGLTFGLIVVVLVDLVVVDSGGVGQVVRGGEG